MCAKKSKLEIYSLEQFRKADRLDRIRMNMVEPDRFPLNGDDWQYSKDLEHGWLLVSGETREGVAVRLIQNHVPGAESWYKANRILRDIETLYAPFLTRNKEMQRRRVIDKLYAFADIAETKAKIVDDEGNEHWDKDWLLMAQKFLKDAAELEGLGADNALAIDPEELVIPEIEITNDPSAFLAEQIEFEDEPEEGFDDDDEA